MALNSYNLWQKAPHGGCALEHYDDTSLLTHGSNEFRVNSHSTPELIIVTMFD